MLLVGIVVLGLLGLNVYSGITAHKIGIPLIWTIEIGETWTDPVTGMEFVWIKEGEFTMGCGESDTKCVDSENPAHPVHVDGFWMGKYEVTNAQYRMSKEGASHDSGKYQGQSLNGSNQPVVNVSWYDAKAYADWLTEQSGGQYTFRLPTEAEWEYAARAGSKTIYSFGNDDGQLGEYAWYDQNSKNQTHPVGQKKKNEWGLYDMYGNVWEWCQDWYDKAYYEKSPANKPVNNPQGPASGSEHVFRGGSRDVDAMFCRPAHRGSDPGRGGIDSVGFRLVRTPS
jgi:formylglycine-generating enzyme required for sulfatase activity